MALAVKELTEEALETALEEGELFIPPSIETLEKYSAAALTPAALAKLIYSDKKKPKQKKKMVQLVAIKPTRPPKYRSKYTYAKVPRPIRARYGRRMRRPIFGQNKDAYMSFRARTGNILAGSSRSKGRVHVITRMNITRLNGVTNPLTSLSNQNFGNGNGNGVVGMDFKLSDFLSYTDFTAIYRWYKILWVKVTMYPEQNTHVAAKVHVAADIDSTAYAPLNFDGADSDLTGLAPHIIFAPDKSNSDGFATEGEAYAHDKAKFHMFNDGRELQIYLTPHPRDEVGLVGAPAEVSSAPKWLSTDAPDIQHYGIRTLCKGWHNQFFVKCITTMKVAFKEHKL